jgi:hypothetical protein
VYSGTKNICGQPQRIRLSRIRHGTASLHGTLAEHHQDPDEFSKLLEIKLRMLQKLYHWVTLLFETGLISRSLRLHLQVPPFLMCKLFTQVFSFINVQLFNSLLLRRECCSFSNGEYVKAGLDELEHWCHWLTEEYAGSSWDELKNIRQAVTLLILEDKHRKSLKEITDDFCPVSLNLYLITYYFSEHRYDVIKFLLDVFLPCQ